MFSNNGFVDAGVSVQILVIGIVSFAAYILFKGFRDVFLSPLRHLPGPPMARISASYMTPAMIAGRRAHKLYELHQQYGPVVRIGRNEVSVADWTAYRDIYGGKASGKEESFYSAATFLGHENIFSMRNRQQHAARRKLQSSSYSQQAVAENEGLVASRADALVDRMSKGVGSVNSVDVFRVCGMFSLEVILKCAFDWETSNSDADMDFASHLLQAMDGAAALLLIDSVLPFLRKTGIGRYVPGFIGDAYRCHEAWQSTTRKLLRDFSTNTRSTDKSLRFMATPLLIAEDTYLGRRLTEDEAVEEAMGIAFAGSGTTSTTLIYLLYAMSRPENAQRQERLCAEVKLGGAAINEVKDLPYLNAVIKETMRLYPTIISTLPRTLEAPISLPGGQVLPPGTDVGMANYLHHRDPTVFSNPEEFLPERWLESTASEKLVSMNSALTPFSVGSHNCIGQNLARAELYLAVSKVFRRLSLSLGPEMTEGDMEMEDRFNIAPKGRKLLLQVLER